MVRGKFILENLFNQKIPPPSPNVPDLKLDTNKRLVGTVRQVFEQHRENPTCAGYHARRMDPLRLRAGELFRPGRMARPGKQRRHRRLGRDQWPANSPPRPSSARWLETRKGDFRRAVVRKVLSYALGGGIQEPMTGPPIASRSRPPSKRDGDKFSSVILNVARGYPFQNARNGLVTAKAASAPEKKAESTPGLQPISLPSR